MFQLEKKNWIVKILVTWFAKWLFEYSWLRKYNGHWWVFQRIPQIYVVDVGPKDIEKQIYSMSWNTPWYHRYEFCLLSKFSVWDECVDFLLRESIFSMSLIVALKKPMDAFGVRINLQSLSIYNLYLYKWYRCYDLSLRTNFTIIVCDVYNAQCARQIVPYQ